MRTIRILAAVAVLLPALRGTAATAQSAADRLSWHGYASQAVGVATQVPILGFNRDPSTDMRTAGIQARYAISPSDNFIIQLGSRSMGTSPLSLPSATVLLDWAFYQHQFAHASLKVGRIPTPFGLLSEVRDVGTLVPFYRAPASTYLENYRSMDGVLLAHRMNLLGGSLESQIFGGGTDGRQIVWLPTGNFVNAKLRFERVNGILLTYTTPIDGIRLLGGISSVRMLDTAKVQLASARKVALANAGIEAIFDRFMARGEARRSKIDSNDRNYAFYGQTGVRLTSKLWFNQQMESIEVDNNTAAGQVKGVTVDDRALGLSYTFAPNLVGKLEKHWAHGGVDAYTAPGASQQYTTYAIASLSVSF